MTSYSEQIAAARAAHRAASAIESQMRQQVDQAFQDWEAGRLDAQSIRHRLEAIVRSGYRSAVAVATQQTVRQADVPKWRPTKVFNTPYLQSLLSDVRSNLRDYKASDQDEAARRRVVFRTEHSVGTGVQRGYTDALVDSYSQVSDTFGSQVRKFWIAGGSNPCPRCWALNGTEVGLHEHFPVPKGSKVYGNLLGCPLHPHCQCFLANLLVSLDNLDEPVNVQAPPTPAPLTMSADDVKNMTIQQFNLVAKFMGTLDDALVPLS